MRFFTAPILLAGVALAQDYGGGSNNNAKTTSTTAAPASSAAAAANGVQTIVAGQSGLTYSPNSVTAAVGSTVEIRFAGPGHTFTSSSFGSPCQGNDSSIFSGIIGSGASSNIATNVFTIQINSTDPIWFYCSVPGHCSAGMVGVINPPSSGSQTLSAYKAAAANAGNTFTPSAVRGGVVGPARAANSGPSSTSSTTSAPTSTPTTGAASYSSGSVSWAAVLMTGVAAWGFGTMLM
ncbi:hypothetical protein B7463_g11567, partial [Scytalidium lignicola]